MSYGLYFCKACGICYHEIRADKYDPDLQPNATWFQLRPFYRSNSWGSFPENDPAISGAGLWCPGCGASYTDVHGNTYWFHHDKGTSWGKGPAAFREMNQKESESEPEPETKTEAKAKSEFKSESKSQLYKSKKKNVSSGSKRSKGNKGSSKKQVGKNNGKKREALKNLSEENADG